MDELIPKELADVEVMSRHVHLLYNGFFMSLRPTPVSPDQTEPSGSLAECMFLPKLTVRTGGEEYEEYYDIDILRIQWRFPIYGCSPAELPLEAFFPDLAIKTPRQLLCLDGSETAPGFVRLHLVEIQEDGSKTWKHVERNETEDSPAYKGMAHVFDRVDAYPLLEWPAGTTDVFHREHPSGWIDSELQAKLRAALLLLVSKAHWKSTAKNKEYRISFSMPEKVLSLSLPQTPRHSYLTVKLIAKCELKDTAFRTYHIKTTCYWLMELNEKFASSSMSVSEGAEALLHRLKQSFHERRLPSFLVPNLNLLEAAEEAELQEVEWKLTEICEDLPGRARQVKERVTVHDYREYDRARAVGIDVRRELCKTHGQLPAERAHNLEKGRQKLAHIVEQYPGEVVLVADYMNLLCQLGRLQEASKVHRRFEEGALRMRQNFHVMNNLRNTNLFFETEETCALDAQLQEIAVLWDGFVLVSHHLIDYLIVVYMSHMSEMKEFIEAWFKKVTADEANVHAMIDKRLRNKLKLLISHPDQVMSKTYILEPSANMHRLYGYMFLALGEKSLAMRSFENGFYYHGKYFMPESLKHYSLETTPDEMTITEGEQQPSTSNSTIVSKKKHEMQSREKIRAHPDDLDPIIKREVKSDSNPVRREPNEDTAPKVNSAQEDEVEAIPAEMDSAKEIEVEAIAALTMSAEQHPETSGNPLASKKPKHMHYKSAKGNQTRMGNVIHPTPRDDSDVGLYPEAPTPAVDESVNRSPCTNLKRCVVL